MPVLEVDIVGELDPVARKGIAARLADVVGHALRSRPGGTWVKVTLIPRGLYAENAGGPEPGVLPVFVRLLSREVPEGEALAAQVRDLTRAVALVCGRPETHVHVLYEPPAKGRLAFGGKLVD